MENEIITPKTEANAEVPVKAPKAKKEPKAKSVCWCGCGGLTNGKFVPGHDARFHSRAKKVARGELNLDEQLAILPHDEARAEFVEHVEKEKPKAAARAEAEAKKKADRETKAAQKLAEKAAKEAESQEPDAEPAVLGGEATEPVTEEQLAS